jgi:hypothetical protein
MTSQCAVCGFENEVPAEPRVDAVEPPDFDTRPGEPLRSTINSWVSCCRNCTYCAADISVAHAKVLEILHSETYQRTYLDETMPPKAREFLCYAVILDKLREHSDAGWSALHAAWVCDDERDPYAGVRCREQAIEYWKRGKHAGQPFSDDHASEYALVADLHRRMSQFELAMVTCSEALDMDDVPPVIENILRRQKTLVEQHDTDAHSIRELFVPTNRSATELMQ